MVIAAAEPDALREAAFFVDRLSGDKMPLAGLVLNRTHPTLSFAARRSRARRPPTSWSEGESASTADALTAAVLRVHAHRAVTAKREMGLLRRFTAAHPQGADHRRAVAAVRGVRPRGAARGRRSAHRKG